LTAALRFSGLETELRTVEEVLHPEPVPVDREAAHAALLRDKKTVDGEVRLVLLDAPGKPRYGVRLDAGDVRAALDALIR
jgi:3-dehydroquinate synthetase